VLLSFLIESTALALIGGLIGSVAALLMSRQRISMVNTATWSELSFGFEATFEIVLTAILIAAAMGVVGGIIPAIRATKIDPAQAMRGA
jgi:putative ABC transport system permease protein